MNIVVKRNRKETHLVCCSDLAQVLEYDVVPIPFVVVVVVLP